MWTYVLELVAHTFTVAWDVVGWVLFKDLLIITDDIRISMWMIIVGVIGVEGIIMLLGGD